MMLLLVIKQFREQDIAQLRAPGRRHHHPAATANPPPPCWVGLSDAEYAAQLAQLRAWVDGVALTQWPGYLDQLPLCWLNHPEAVWEFSNLMAEWTRVYADPNNRPLQDALWFFERWLPGALTRLRTAIECTGLAASAPPSGRRRLAVAESSPSKALAHCPCVGAFTVPGPRDALRARQLRPG